MNDLISTFRKDLIIIINNLQEKKIIDNFDLNNLSIDFSSKSKRGDLSTNLFILLSKKLLKHNFNLKDYIITSLNNLDYIENIDIVSAGFINTIINDNFKIIQLKNIFKKNNIINSNQNDSLNINVEFVSANPTGPIHIAHVRGAVLGDVISKILERVGHKVTKEYYVNDSGSQINILAHSLFKRYQQRGT